MLCYELVQILPQGFFSWGQVSLFSWWGSYSNWMDKAVNSVSSASVLGAEALTSVVETAKQKVKKPSCNHMSNQGCTLIVL